MSGSYHLISRHCGQWEIFFGLSSGPFITVTCMSIHGNTWTDALHAARFNCFDFVIVSFRGGLVPLSLYVVPMANSVCIGLMTCFTSIVSCLVYRLNAL